MQKFNIHAAVAIHYVRSISNLMENKLLDFEITRLNETKLSEIVFRHVRMQKCHLLPFYGDAG
jgi:hypothetical protein